MVSVFAITAQPLYILASVASVSALGSPTVVYDALPSVSPQTNYPSVGYEATSTSELGDYVHLGGTNRKLNTVTVTMSDWAKFADYTTDPLYAANSTTWSLPVTLNVYSGAVDASGTPTTKLATVTQTIVVPWRPASDPDCSTTSNGTGWKVDGTCYNYSGVAFNATFDLSGAGVTLPNDVIVSVAFNTHTHGYAPTNISGPYDSLNVAVPASQAVTVGTDDSSDGVVVNSTWDGAYGSTGSTGVLRKDTGWSPYGTVAMQISASAPIQTTACTTTNTVASSSLNGWYMGETRATGHNEISADGLHIWTEGNTSTDKAAGYYGVDFPLQNLGTQTIASSIDYDATIGVTPGLQLAVDFDNNGTFDGYLVGESIYDNNWWLSNSAAQFAKDGAPNTGGGNGSSWFGTANEWLNSFPNVRVKAIGYSLGSGVHGDGMLKRITLGCTNYTFGLAAPTNLKPSDGTITNDPAFVNSWNVVEGAHGYEYRTANVLNGADLGTVIYSDSTTSQPGRYSTSGSTVTRQNGGTPEGNYYWQVRAVDSAGNPGPWSVISKVTVDTSAPAVPTNLTLTATPSDVSIPTGGSTSSYGVIAKWDNISGTDHYMYKYWNDISSSAYNSEAHALAWSVSTNQNAGVFNQGEGTHYFAVSACDIAGNCSAYSTPFVVIYDTTAPSVPANGQPRGGAYKTTNDFYFTWDVSTDSSPVTYEFQSSGSNSIDSNGSLVGSWNSITNGNSEQNNLTSPQIHSTGAPDGHYYWQVRAIDATGNKSAWSSVWDMNIDTHAPAVPTATLTADNSGTNVANGGYTNSQYFTFHLPAGASRYQLKYWNGIDSSAFKGETNAWNPTDLSGYMPTATTYKDNFTQGEGIHYFAFSACDAAGNCSAYSSPFAVTYDKTAPILTVDPIANASNTTPAITGTTSEFGGDVYLWVDGTKVATVPSDSTGNWSWTTSTPLAIGTHKVLATAKDAAGNTSEDDTLVAHSYWKQFTIQPVAAVLGATTTTPSIAAITTTPAVTPTISSGAESSVENNEAGQVLAAEDTKTATTNGDEKSGSEIVKEDSSNAGKVLGLKWFWWLIILLAVLSIWWFIAAWRRRREDENL